MGLNRADPKDLILRLPSPVILNAKHLNVETQRLSLEHPWFEFMFETYSPKRGDLALSRPYTDPSLYHGVRKYRFRSSQAASMGSFWTMRSSRGMRACR